MIVITGAAGFIASCFVARLNQEGYNDLVLVDDFTHENKTPNYQHKKYSQRIDRKEFVAWLDENHAWVQMVFHLGARTDTTEFNTALLNELNLDYSKQVWTKCVEYGLPLVYASSAATYGDGAFGFDDAHEFSERLVPLNPYGVSKNEFDKWVLTQERKPYFWVGLKFFNVYGPNEYHKGRMASVIFHTYHQIQQHGYMNLFRSHHPDFKDGEQSRDFIYVKDVCSVLFFFMLKRKASGIYNLGSGKARTFNDLAKAVFNALNLQSDIRYIDTPEDIRDKYQYFTQARMEKLRSAGYLLPFTTLEQGVEEYVKQYLSTSSFY